MSAPLGAGAIAPADQVIWLEPPPWASSAVLGSADAYYPDLDKNSHRLRDDYIEEITKVESWRPILNSGRQVVLGLHENIFSRGPFKHYTNAPITDAQLLQLIDFVTKNQIKVSITTGGLRLAGNDRLFPDPCSDKTDKSCWGAGRRQAELEYSALLKRWLSHGGPIHFITTDHPIYWAADAVGKLNPDGTLVNHITLSLARHDEPILLQHHIQELLRYYSRLDTLIHEEYPQNPALQFVTILGPTAFKVRAPTRSYPSNAPAYHLLHNVDLGDFATTFTLQTEAMNRASAATGGVMFSTANLRFMFDAGPQTVFSDGTFQDWNFERIVAAESILQQAHYQVGFTVHPGSPMITHTYGKADVECVLPSGCLTTSYDAYALAKKTAFGLERRLLDGFLRAGGAPDMLVFQGWHRYPSQIGPPSESYSWFHAVHVATSLYASDGLPKVESSSTGSLHPSPQLHRYLKIWKDDKPSSLKSEERVYALNASASGEYRMTNFESVTEPKDFTLQVTVKPIDLSSTRAGWAAVHLGKARPGSKVWNDGYAVIFRDNGAVSLYYRAEVLASFPVHHVKAGQEVFLQVKAIGEALEVIVDGEKLAKIDAPAANLQGTISFDAYQEGAQFSDPMVLYHAR